MANPTENTNTQNNANTAASETRNIYNLIILDESGSMISIYEPALSGVNETLQTIRSDSEENPGRKQFVTLVAFDTNHYKAIYNHVAAADATDITEEHYRPCGGTPLYDAMGRAINDLRAMVKKGDVVLVTIITDGYENASKEYNHTAIKSLVEAMKAEGWVFTYIGANQDVEKVAHSFSIENHLSFQTTVEGTQAMFAKERSARKRFFNRMNDKVSSYDLNMDYFADDEA